jgi:hypothetical protein
MEPDFGCRQEICCRGILPVWRYSNELQYWAQYIFRCSDCHRSKTEGIPEMCVDGLIEQGYQIETPEFDRTFGEQFRTGRARDGRIGDITPNLKLV